MGTTPSVSNTSSTDSNKEKSGNVFVIDPNPPGMEIIPPEDLFIYVKFSAYPRSRTTYGGTLEGDAVLFDSGVEDEVNFISTKISYKEGKLEPNPQKTYATTDWTEIGGFKRSDTRSSGILEGFGIKNIDIKYNASLVPVVDITFTDVRGSALFDVVESDDRKTPYSLFFKMPYPVFKLSVKGYFGQKVDYCLHMVNWTSNFDGSTGNFDISANFLGFQQAFLNDMVIGNIIGAINTPEGRANLDNIYDGRIAEGSSSIPSDNGQDLRQIDDFLTKIAKIQIDSEIIKSDSNNFNVLKNLNGKLKLLKSIRTFIGTGLVKQAIEGSKEEKEQIDYLKRENRYNSYDTSRIKDDELKLGDNYLSIRDFIVFKSINTNAFKSYVNTLTNIITKYNEYINGIAENKANPVDSVSNQKEEQQKIPEGLQDGLRENYDDNIINSFNIAVKGQNNEDKWENFLIYTEDENGRPLSKKLSDVLDKFINGSGSDNIPIGLTTNYVGGDDGVNVGFNIKRFTTDVLVDGEKGGKYYKNPYKFKEDTNVFVIDFRKQRDYVEDGIQKLEEDIKVLREQVQIEINEKILKNFEEQFKFRPTINKCFEILANNTQAMVETIWDISYAAEQEGISNNRQNDLKGYETDIVDGAKEVAWQSIYEPNTDGSLKEIYIGEAGVNPNNFPELKFVEDVFKIIVAKRKNLEQISRAAVLKNGLDTDNWFPINPIDYNINPWLRLNSLNSEKEIGEELVKNIFLRSAVLQNYSLFNTNNGLGNIENYADLEAISLNRTIISDNTRNIIGNLLGKIKNQITSNSVIDDNKNFKLKQSQFWLDFIEEDGGTYKIKEENKPEINGIRISGKFEDDVEYIEFDNKSIINNSKKLFKEIKDDINYRQKIIDRSTEKGRNGLFVPSKSGDYIYKNIYVNNNLNTYNAYNVWDESVRNGILKNKNSIITNNLNGVSLNNFNPSGTTSDGKFLNVSYMEEFLGGSDSGCTYGNTMIESNLYKQNDKYARGLLLLSTFPFRKFEDSFIKSVFGANPSFNGARVVNLPKLYINYLGGLLMRYEGELNINFNVTVPSATTCSYKIFETPKEKYLNVGYQRLISEGKDIPNLEENLTKLPNSVKKQLIKKFKLWVDGDRFNNTLNGFFEFNMNYLLPSVNETTITEQNKKSGGTYILNELQDTTNLIIFNPQIFNPERENELLVLPSEIVKYVNQIESKFNKVNIERDAIPEPETDEEIKKQTLEKLQIYNYFKNINNKWVGGDKRSFNICGGGNKNLIDYFKFIDRGWRNIGDEATFNLKSFLTLGSNLNTSVYFFMSKLLRDSNFLFQILPTYINYKDVTEVAKMFQPQTQLETNSESGPIFCCIYVGGASEVLDISERSNYYFKNDGYRFPNPNDPNDKGDLPSDMVGPDDSSLVAFRVAFGAQNQTVFKNVSLSQQEHKETGEYFRALSDLVDKRGGTQQTYVGTDLLRLFKTRSYTCKVDSLGCMNIQPLMYFDLQNVPFFNGAYLITSVNHSISPNHMTTNFQGVRQSKFISPPSNKITAELDLDLNESSEVPKIKYTNLENTNPKFTIGVLNPTELFNFEANFDGENGLTNFKNLGVTQFADERLREIIDTFKIVLSGQSNSEVTMFMGAVLSNSDNLVNKELSWEINSDGDKVTDGTNTLFYDDVSKADNTIKNDPTIKKYSDSYLSSIPLFTTGTTDNIAYNPPGNPDLSEFSNNEIIEKRKSELENKIENETDATKKENLKKELKKELQKEENLINTLPYYNIFNGDAYRFKPRGYLYLIGRKQYNDFADSSAITNPSKLSSTEEEAILTSINVWKKYTGNTNTNKTAFELSNTGKASSYSLCVQIAQQYKSPGIESAFNSFENVLTVFTDGKGTPLIDFNNP